MKKKRSPSAAPPNQAGVMPVNLIISPVKIEPTATLTRAPIVVGGPIMREGFITETGVMVVSSKP